MFKVYGEIYTFDIKHETIDITSIYSGMHNIHVDANPEEDFSVFDLGPAIANDIKICCQTITIDNSSYSNACLHVVQYAGKSIVIDIHEGRANIEDPVDSGRIILTIRDYVNKYE